MKELLINKYKPTKIQECYFDTTNMTILENFIANKNFNFIVQGESGCGKSSLINIIINNYYNSNTFLINANVCYITILKDQGINFYKNDIKLNTINTIDIVSLEMGENKKKKTKTVDFTFSDGNLSFSHKFDMEDTYPVTVLVNNKPVLGYLIEVSE